MTKESTNITEAKKSLKYHIRFLESLLTYVRGDDEILKGRAMWATWCLHRYINDKLVSDIEKAMQEYGNTETNH